MPTRLVPPHADPLLRAALEIDGHVAARGWDLPPSLFALVPTATLAAAEPDLAESLVQGGATLAEDELSSIEQTDLPETDTLEALLGRLAWPAVVAGLALTVERIAVPPGAVPTRRGPNTDATAPSTAPDGSAEPAASAESATSPGSATSPAAPGSIPLDADDETAAALAAHPDAVPIRLVVAVLRDGGHVCLVRRRDDPDPDAVAIGRDIAPALVQALRATLEE